MTATLELTCDLISRSSISPADGGCQDLLCARLEKLGFTIESLPFGEVSNFWARRGDSSPLLCFAGHTDVVPPGNLEQWQSDPFKPEVRDGRLFGRGAADMKGSLAAMLTACERFIAENPDFSGSIAFLVTSDEESVALDGTRRVIEVLQGRDEKIDYCIVGEPSSSEMLGDVVRNGRRGSLNGTLTVHGTEGHVAYPDLASNPIHRFMPALAALCEVEWDQGNEYFPPTSFQISNIHAGEGTNNVIPGEMHALFNFRFSSELSAEQLQERTEALLNQHYSDYSLEWQLSGNPFITSEGVLTGAVKEAIKEVTGVETLLSTGGGTSDGRFIAPTGTQVVEVGPCNRSIHKVNEEVLVEDLDKLSRIFEAILGRILA
ncbi:MAG: succinyl-diaminopimelate desuccinylase [Gammaproteobacteria bacterium]|jgi:succinyl-diaminopimelate desuccinylase|nr:succinyl-diaminopimelate desuccinylase [Gammaproteobacteria bacterium]